jgi:hypothetical protein
MREENEDVEDQTYWSFNDDDYQNLKKKYLGE